MNDQTVAFVYKFSRKFPEIGVLLDSHKTEYSGEILTHVVFGDISRLVVRLQKRSRTSPTDLKASGLLDNILKLLEDSFRTETPEIRNLISVSFLENVAGPTEAEIEIREKLGTCLSEEMQKK